MSDSQNLFLIEKDGALDTNIESADWAIEIKYNKSFDFIDYWDFRSERIFNLLYALSLLTTIDWVNVRILFTLKRHQTEQLITFYSLSSPWFWESAHFTLKGELEQLSFERLKLFALYKRRLSAIRQDEDNHLFIAIEFYRYHLTLDSEYMRMMALFISLESLFNIGSSEISRTIGLCVAYLLGISLEDRRDIFKEMTTLYSFRSRITHGSIASTARRFRQKDNENFDDLRVLHDYTRLCLRKIIETKQLTSSFINENKRIDLINKALLTGKFC